MFAEVENEEHVLLHCELYSDIRDKFNIHYNSLTELFNLNSKIMSQYVFEITSRNSNV